MPCRRISEMPSESAGNDPKKSRCVRLRTARCSDGKDHVWLCRCTIRSDVLFCDRNAYTSSDEPPLAVYEN